MNTKEFIHALAEKLDVNHKEAAILLQHTTRVIRETVSEEKKLTLLHTGSFQVNKSASRTAYIPEPEPFPQYTKQEPEGTASEIVITEGNHLFKLAREVYSNPYFWVLIYKENLGKIPDPDMVISGVEMTIPALEGSPDKLTRNDSNSVSEGYRLVYEFYKAKEDARADDCFRAMKRYKPKLDVYLN